MTSAAPSVASSPSSSSSSATEGFSITEPTCCVVQLRHQRDGVVHQVVLDPAKARYDESIEKLGKGALLRLGDWPGDEAAGWQFLSNISIIAKLGRAERATDPDKGAYTKVTPL